MNLWPFIEVEEAEQHSVTRACALLEVSRAAYYEQRKLLPSRRALDEAKQRTKIKTSTPAPRAPTGRPASTLSDAVTASTAARKRVARLLVRAGLAGRCPRRWRTTTIADPGAEARAVDLIKRVLSGQP